MSVTEYFTRAAPEACNLGPYESRWHSHITETVCNVFGVTQEELHGADHHRCFVHARWAAFRFLSKHRGYSTVRIGKLFGKHHTTVMHGLNTICERMEADEDFRQMILTAECRLFHRDETEAA